MPYLTIEPFVRIITRDNQVVCFNACDVSTFAIETNAKHKVLKAGITKPEKEDDFEIITGDTVRLFMKSGKGLCYVVGQHITAQDFDYVCECLQEMTFLTKAEKLAREQAEVQAKINRFESISNSNPDSDAVQTA